jgi:large subunit ribosomal protein L24e
MVVKRQCSFCAAEIEPGTGMMFVKRDGTIFHFCTSSCRKQQLHLGRVGHRLKWTRAHALKKAADRSAAAARPVGGRTTIRGGRRETVPAKSAEPARASAPAAPPPAPPSEPEPATAPAAPAEESKPAPKPRTRAKKPATGKAAAKE